MPNRLRVTPRQTIPPSRLPRFLERRVSHQTITDQAELLAFCDRLSQCAWLGFDTEFVAEHTYRPQLCLVQVAAEDQLVLIDALAVEDMTPFWRAVVEGDQETIVHAGRGELEFCHYSVDAHPARLFDTQIAAGLVGIEYPAGFRNLITRILHERPKRHETRTDWRRRPLSDRQVEYALDDVRYLKTLRDTFCRQLERLDRIAWFRQEMDRWMEETEQSFRRERWRRLPGSSSLDRKMLAIVRELWRWRESEAQRRDRPPRRVIRDDLLVELARRQSADPKHIKAVRGMERRDTRRLVPEISQAIAQALQLPEDQWPAKSRRDQAPQMSVLGQFLFAALGSVCRQTALAPGLVGSPSDVRELIAYRTGHGGRSDLPRLASGWRAEVIGGLFDELLAGDKVIRIADPASEHPLVFESLDGHK